MENSLLLVAALALVVALVASVVAWRAGRRARRAADRVAQLLLSPVVVPRPAPATAPSPRDLLADVATPVGVVPLASRAGRAAAVGTPPQGTEPAPARIPVLDLDRLRAWLTSDDIDLARLAVVSVELDNLPIVEERLGRGAGEQLVEAIAERLRTVTRPRDVVAHVNRERFVVVCRGVPDRQAASTVAERIAMGVAHPSVVVDGVAEVTASVGVALANGRDESPDKVLRRAIEAGNRAKATGGAHIELSEQPVTTEFADGELAAAIARDELRVHYLPIVSCATGRVAGFEALVRWEHPEHGLLLPGAFLPEAEERGTIVAVGMWTIEQACRQMARWQHGAGGSLKLDLNLSPRQFADPALATRVGEVIAEHGLAPGAVWLEVTESTLLHDRDASERTLHELRELGVRLVIDDFGTGASSLTALRAHPLDAIKIAATFVADLGRDRDNDAICAAIIELAHSLGLCAIAEGVERLDQFAALRSLGCELVQGHLFGAARPAEAYGATPATMLGVVGSSGSPTSAF